MSCGRSSSRINKKYVIYLKIILPNASIVKQVSYFIGSTPIWRIESIDTSAIESIMEGHLCAHRATTSILGPYVAVSVSQSNLFMGWTTIGVDIGRISIEKNSFISTISSNRFDTVLSFVAEEEEFDITAVKYSRWRSTAPEIRRSVFLAVEIHARRYRQPRLTNRRKLGAARETYSWRLAQGMHDYERE